MLGMQIGRVAGFKMDQNDQVAVVEFTIGKDVRIYEDAMASIKTDGLLGDKYVKIDAGGGADLLKPGGAIRDTEAPVDLMELISKYAFGDVEKKSPKDADKGGSK
jgi:phospholipid/cholesterol/gamma-HCH transport system substrate-binding protein